MKFLCTSLGMVLAASASAQVVNGNFEPGAGGHQTYLPGGSTLIPGWTTTDTGAEWFLPTLYGYSNSPGGGYVVELTNYTFPVGGIRQSIPTIPGRAYTLRYFLASVRNSGRDGSCEISVTAGPAVATHSIATTGQDFLWEQRELLFTADSVQSVIAFRCTQDPFLHFADIDAVEVVAACPADFNNDGFLDFFDADAFLAAFESGDPSADFNGDGFLDFFDADGFVEAFEAGC